MKFFLSTCICFLLSSFSLVGYAQDILFLKGKELPLKGSLISNSNDAWITSSKLLFLKEGTVKPKLYRMDKVGAVLTRDHQLYVEPKVNHAARDFGKFGFGLIFLTNGHTIAIDNWEISGLSGEVEYVDFFTGETHNLSQEKFVAIYSKDPDLQIFGNQKTALLRLRTAFLPEVPTRDLEVVNTGINEYQSRAEPEKPQVEISEDFEAENLDAGSQAQENTGQNRPSGPEMPINMDDFNEKARAKVQKFASYVKTILEGEDRMRIRAITDQALILFVSDTCYIEVSSIHRAKPLTFNVRRYFNRLNYLANQYTKIEITDGQVVKVSDIRKYKDTWYGTVTYGQRFTGYKDGIMVYTDYTQKNINIVLKVYEPEIEGESEAIWDVLLSNISVTETSQ